MSNSENPSEYSLIFKRLIYGDVEPKGEPLTVLELEGNFAHLKDYINSLTTKLSDNTDSISKMSESITDLQKRVEKLEGGSPEEEYFSIEYLNTSSETLNSIQKSANEYGKANGGIDFGNIVDNPFIYHLGKREVGDNLYLGGKDGKYYLLSDINTSKLDLVDDTYTVRVSGGAIVSISETTTTTTTTEDPTLVKLTVNNILNGTPQTNKKIQIHSQRGFKEPEFLLLDDADTDANGTVVLNFNYISGKDTTYLIKGFNGPSGSKVRLEWFENITIKSGGEVSFSRVQPLTTQFDITITAENQIVSGYQLTYSDSKTRLSEILGLPIVDNSFTTNELGVATFTITSDAELVMIGGGEAFVNDKTYNGFSKEYDYELRKTNITDSAQLEPAPGYISLENVPAQYSVKLSRISVGELPLSLTTCFTQEGFSSSDAQFSINNTLTDIYRIDVYAGQIDWDSVNWIATDSKDGGYYEDTNGKKPIFTKVIENVTYASSISIDINTEFSDIQPFYVYQLSTDDGNSLFGTDTFSQSSTWDGTYRIVVQNAQPFFQTDGQINENSIGRQVYYLNTNGGLEPFTTSGYIGGNVEKIILDELGCVLSVNETPTYESVSEYAPA